MTAVTNKKINRRNFLKRTAIATAAGAAALGAGSYWLGSQARVSRAAGTKVIVIGIDGMDPRLSERMMAEGLLPNLARLRASGGFRRLGTSTPPQSPVAWANFINGAGPGSHGIFDFMHRHPDEPWSERNPFYGAAETIPGEGTVLRRQGVPFWDFLVEAGVPSTFYDLPCNYPASRSQHGLHRCLCGMGTPDLLGTYGTFQHYAEDGPPQTVDDGGGKRSRLVFRNETAEASIIGPENPDVHEPEPLTIDFLVHRDRQANAAVIEIQGHRILLNAGQWSRWTRLNFALLWLRFPNNNVSGICRFFLQEVTPNFRLYVTPVNIDPSAPAVPISEPGSFVGELSDQLGLFYTAGFQEDYSALKQGVFSDDEFIRQAGMVLEERLALFEHAVADYDDGLLFFYFSSSDLQSHMLWWDSDKKHPIRSEIEARSCFKHVWGLYRRLDQVIGEIFDRYGSQATILVMSDHGFANFGRQFNLNTWLRANDYLGPPDCTRIIRDPNIDWSRTAAYGLGINGLYLNLKGREPHGTIEPGAEQDAMLDQIARHLESVRDDGRPVIRRVVRTDKEYKGPATALAPDLVVGYCRGYRASWATVLGDLTEDWLLDNDSAWSADHCADALEVPGVLFSNRPIRAAHPSLVDVAPSILAEFGLKSPSTMEGRNIF
jgi:predicted AlkP superfamily phosphohydrolase/phosphomutase